MTEEEKKDGAAAAEPEAKSGGSVQTMKRGDYMIHVYVEQAKNMKMDADDTVDPIVEVTCLGERKFTTAKDDINNTGIAVWNEHLFFEPKNCESEKLEQGKITFKLMDKGFFKDATIGYYEFDLSYIYLMKDHALMHKWIIMSNPESEDFGEVTGYLKISITIAAAGDEQISITEDPNPGTDDVIQPPQITPEFYQLKIRFFCGQKIVPMDKSFIGKAKIDAYVSLQYKTKKLKTKMLVQEEGGQVHWNQEFLVPAQIPIMGGRMVFKVWDEDTLSDDVVGAIVLNSKDIIGDKNGTYFWKNVYGAPLAAAGAQADSMNENPELGSLWKGRILMQVLAEKTEKPCLKVADIPKEDVEKAAVHLQDRSYQIMVQINSSIALPFPDTKYEVVVRIGEKEIKSGAPSFNKGRYNRYNFKTTPEQAEYKAPYLNAYDLGQVFIYLRGKSTLKGEQNVCYYRAPVSNFMDMDPKIQWLEFQPDLSLGAVTESHMAGLVGIRISIHDVTSNGPADWKQGIWGQRVPRRPGNLKARAYIYQCRDLPAADSDGTSDPFIMVTDSDVPQRTVTVEDNLNPIFYQALDLIYEANNVEEMPPFIVDCYDEDVGMLGGKGNSDYLARAVIQVGDIKFSEGDAILRPEWYPMRFNSKAPKSGEILVSFAIVEDDFSFQKSLDYVHLDEQVDMQEFQVSMNVLGLRGLQSPGILPVKKAFINFNLKSLVAPSQGSNLANLKTEPKNPGPDPTINTLMTFLAPLPLDPLFCPRLSCQVYDCIFTGWSQPIIGNFTIPIGDLIHELKDERVRETNALQKVVDQLNRIASGEDVQSFYQAAKKYNAIEEEDTNDEDIKKALEDNRMSQKDKKKLNDQFSKRDEDSSIVSINGTADVDSQPLLTGDFDEEKRMQPTLKQKALDAKHGKTERMSEEQIDTTERKLTMREKLVLGEQADEGQKKIKGMTPSATKINPKLKKALMVEEQERVDKAKRNADDMRKRETMKFMKARGGSSAANIIWPQYKRDPVLDIDREVDAPPESMFIGLGWDEDAATKRKHYRRFYPDELENVTEVLPVPSPFQSYEIKRGQTRGAKAGFWASLTSQVKQDESGQDSSEQVMGKFKAVIEVEVKEEKKKYFDNKKRLFNELMTALKKLSEFKNLGNLDLDLDKLDTLEGREELEVQMEPLGVRHLKITKTLADIQSDVILQKMLLQNNKVIVRAYMISAFDLASRDVGGFSDPYLILSVGDKTFSDRDNYVLDEPSPTFCKHYDFEAVFPGCPPLVIKAMDYDALFGDDLIGTTICDLEDRYFLPEWRALSDKPVEFRQIYHPSSGVSQGVIKMWVEINPAKVAPGEEEPLYDITQKPPYDMEIRLCVFDTKDIKMMDIEGTSDVFVKAFFDNETALETDTHFRCQTGKASFNYRLKFKESYPRKDYRMSIQAFDRDFFKSNDIIGSSIIDLKQAFEDVSLTRRPLGINKTYFEEYMKKDGMDFEWKDDQTFWLPMTSKNDKGQIENNGYVRVQIDIVPADYADKNKVGSAREEPNANPFLAPPIGRLSFSLNPCKMYAQLVGPEMRRKICIYGTCIICLVLCVAITIYIIPTIIGTIIAGWLTP